MASELAYKNYSIKKKLSSRSTYYKNKPLPKASYILIIATCMTLSINSQQN